MRKSVTRSGLNVTRDGGKSDMKWIQALTMWAGLAAVAFLLAVVYSLNLPRIIP